MKTSFFVAVLFATSCSSTQYFESAAEVDILKNTVYASSKERSTIFKKSYSPSAQIYWNSTVPLNWHELLLGIEESLTQFDEFELLPTEEIHLIINSKGERWVGLWSVMRVKVGDRERFIPFHVSAQFIDTKIVREAAYWDNLAIEELINP